MTAPAVDVDELVDEHLSGHPDWCAGGHHCTAADGGEHASDQLVWDTAEGQVIVTRYERTSGSQHLEVRHVLRLADEDEERRQHRMRVLVAISERLLREVVRWPIRG